MKKQNYIKYILVLVVVLIMILSGCDKEKAENPTTDSSENITAEEWT